MPTPFWALMCQGRTGVNRLRTSQGPTIAQGGKLRYRATWKKLICSPERGITKRDPITVWAKRHYLEKDQNFTGIHGQTETGNPSWPGALGAPPVLWI